MNCGGCCHLAKTLQTMDKGQTGDRQTIPDPVNIRIEWFLQDTDELLVPVCIKTLATPRRNADEICTRPVDVVIPPPEA